MDLMFPFVEFWWFYAGFTAFVVLLLALDLGVFHRHAHVVSFRESLAWSVVWVTTALLFNYWFYRYAAGRFGPEIGGQLAHTALAPEKLIHDVDPDRIRQGMKQIGGAGGIESGCGCHGQ